MDSFREAYGVLQQHAQTLRNQSEPNIDDLLTIVTESVSAYKVCKQRIDAVEQALKTALDSAEMESAPEPEFEAASQKVASGRSAPPAAASPAAVRRAPPASPPSSFDDIDKDIPF